MDLELYIKLREQSKEARMTIQQAGYGDIVILEFYPKKRPPLARIIDRKGIMKLLRHETACDVLQVIEKAGSRLEKQGWQIEY